jgi:hypothetical protein
MKYKKPPCSIWDLRKILDGIIDDLIDANHAAAISLEFDSLVSPEKQRNDHIWDYIYQSVMWRLFLALARLCEDAGYRNGKSDRHNIKRLIDECENPTILVSTIPKIDTVKSAIENLKEILDRPIIQDIKNNRDVFIAHKLNIPVFEKVQHVSLLNLLFDLNAPLDDIYLGLHGKPSPIYVQHQISQEQSDAWGKSVTPGEFEK